MAKNTSSEEAIEKFAESSALKLIGRASCVPILAILIWNLKTTNETQVAIAEVRTLVAGKVETLNVRMENVDRRIDRIEHRQDSNDVRNYGPNMSAFKGGT